MLFELLKSDIEICDAAMANLTRLNELLMSDRLLSGIGVDALNGPAPAGFPIISNACAAAEMLGSDPCNFHVADPKFAEYWVGIREEENGRIYDTDEVKRRDEDTVTFFAIGSFKTMVKYLDEVVVLRKVDQAIFDRYDRDCANGVDTVESVVTSIVNETYTDIFNLADMELKAGWHQSPLYTRIFEAYQTGGVPCGWIGLDILKGGKPVDCVQLYHLGDTAANS